MKKPFAIALSILLWLLAPVATAERDVVYDSFFLREGNALVQALAVIAGSDYPKVAVPQSLFTEEDPFSDIMSIVGKEPEEVRVFSADTDAYISVLMTMLTQEDASANDFPPEIEEYMLRPRVLSLVLNMINSMSGSNHLVLSSIMTASKSFISPFEPFVPTLAVFFYPDHPYAYAVVYAETGDGVISAGSTILQHNDILDDILALEASSKKTEEEIFALTGPYNDVMDIFPLILNGQTRYTTDTFLEIIKE